MNQGRLGCLVEKRWWFGVQWLWLCIVIFKSDPYCCFRPWSSCELVSALETLSYLLTILADIGVDLVEGTQHIELCGMQAGLLCEVGIHILVTNGWKLGNICIVSAMDRTGTWWGLSKPLPIPTLTQVMRTRGPHCSFFSPLLYCGLCLKLKFESRVQSKFLQDSSAS